MGMIACYMEADLDLINNLKRKNSEDLFDMIESLEEENKLQFIDIGKMWDGLHFLLTGKSTPVRNNTLSEAVVGTNTFNDDEDSEYIAYINPDRLQEIVKAINELDINDLLKNFSPEKFAENQIYPDIWVVDDKDDLKAELLSEFNCLKNFYNKLILNKKGVIVSIY